MDAINSKEYIASLVARSRKAQQIAEGHDQKRVDELCAAVAWAALNEDFRKKAAQMLVDESGMGIVADKAGKIYNKSKGVYRDLKNDISVGIVETNSELQTVKYVKPMGVIGALIPITNGEATPIVKTLWALKARNSIIMAPHPKGKKTCQFVCDYIREVLKKYGAPEDLVITIDPENISVETSNELMKQVDFVVATGGTPMVRVAYSSGTPTIGVGTGNATSYIDASADLDDAASKIQRSKCFDNATSCSTENSLVVDETVYEKFVAALENAGAYIIRESSPEKTALQKAVWPEWPENHTLSRFIVAKSVQEIAQAAGIKLPEGKKFIAVEENGGIGHSNPLTGEKLSIITTLIKAKNFEDGLNKMEAILEYMGKGHSCSIHTKDDAKVDKMALRMKVARVLVNQPQSLGNSGNWFNGLPCTMSLGCSTWGHNSTSNNITWKDTVNYTVVSRPITPNMPTDEDLFPAEIRNAK